MTITTIPHDQVAPRRQTGRRGAHCNYVFATTPDGDVLWQGFPTADLTWQALGRCVREYAWVEEMYSDCKMIAADAARKCFGCPVRDACLEYGLANGETTGCWGGVLAESAEFRALRRQRSEKAA